MRVSDIVLTALAIALVIVILWLLWSVSGASRSL